MRLPLIASLACMVALSPVTANTEDRMDRITANTLCMVVNAFYIREMSLLGAQYGMVSGSTDTAALENQILEPARQAIRILEEDRQKVIKELTDSGVDLSVIAGRISQLVTAETRDNVLSWISITDPRTAQEHLARISTKRRACDAHYKKVRGQPV